MYRGFLLRWCLPTLAGSWLVFAGCSSDEGKVFGGSSGAGTGGQAGGGTGGQSGAGGGQSGSGGKSGSGAQPGDAQGGSAGQTGDAARCPEDPSDDPCALCRKINCCPQVLTCERDTQCAVCADCLVSAAPADCMTECSPQDPETAALLSCMQQNCTEC